MVVIRELEEQEEVQGRGRQTRWAGARPGAGEVDGRGRPDGASGE